MLDAPMGHVGPTSLLMLIVSPFLVKERSYLRLFFLFSSRAFPSEMNASNIPLDEILSLPFFRTLRKGFP